MSFTIIQSANSAKGKLIKVLKEVKELDLRPFDKQLLHEELCEHYEARKGTIKEMIELKHI
ncbi:hypothetical protein LOAG_16591 [Loa loa]|uniref:Uncharacterized protein n=1 Tax=Loa loa TaxID=7209 RepID=A0A1S0UL62_LOALO|nr:hypothetical protein LOAG_16591 [Loa loa]EJD76462.1 hypothetical protein LOAG_16591 [Loa loa]